MDAIMLTYASLTNRHIPVENLPPGEWSLFCDIQDHFETVWAMLVDSSSASYVDQAQAINEFAKFAKDCLAWADKWRTSRWPGGDPLRMIADDMVQRLVLRCEHRVSRLKQEALQVIIQKAAEAFPQEAQQIRQWFQDHQMVSSLDDLIRLRIDSANDWSRSSMPKNILSELRRLAQIYAEELPCPCPIYPRRLSNLKEATNLLVQRLGGQFKVAEETGLNQGNLSKYLRSLSQTPLDVILNTFGLTVDFLHPRPDTEQQGLKGRGAWLLFQEKRPCFGDALHQRFTIRLFFLAAVLSVLDLSPVFWDMTMEVECRFLYTLIPSGIREDFISPYRAFLEQLRGAGVLNSLGHWLIEFQRVAFLRIDYTTLRDIPWRQSTEQLRQEQEWYEREWNLDEIFSLLLPLSLSFLSVSEEENTEDRQEVFLIIPVEKDQDRIRRHRTRAEKEWQEKIMLWPEQDWNYEKILEVESSQVRLIAALALRWWHALWSEGLLPPTAHRWPSFYQELSKWLTAPNRPKIKLVIPKFNNLK